MNTLSGTIFNIGLEFAAFVIALICHLHTLLRTKKGIRSRRRRFFISLTEVVMLASVFSLISRSLEMFYAGPKTFFVMYWTQMLYHMVHVSLPAFYLLYIMEVNGSLIGKTRMFYLFFFAPFLNSELILLCNPFVHATFYYDENYIFHSGFDMNMLYVMSMIYVVIGVYYAIRNYGTQMKVPIVVFTGYVGICLVGLVIQFMYPHILVELFGEALTIIGFMITIENEDSEIDRTTRLYNRDAFIRTSQRLLDHDQEYTVVYIKLTNMNAFQRIMSISQCDDLRSQIGSFLAGMTSREYVFRHDVTGFALILYHVNDHEITRIVEDIAARFRLIWEVDDMNAAVRCVISEIRVPTDARSVDEIRELIENDYDEGDENIPQVRVLRQEALEESRRKSAVERALQVALDQHAFEVYYQPIWSSVDDKIVAAEALVRLNQSEIGPIYPNEFIPIAEKNGMIIPIGTLVFEEVCRFIHDNPLEGLGMKYIELNLSMYQFTRKGLVNQLEGIRKRYGVPIENLNLEITETVSLENDATIMSDTLRHMRSLGYTFSLDDYGSGYSNMQRLLSNNYVNIKIDKSILYDADQNASSDVMLKALIEVVRNLGLSVVQEGVETKEQLDHVLDYGCNLIQGYYFSRPVESRAFLKYVKSYNRMSDDFSF